MKGKVLPRALTAVGLIGALAFGAGVVDSVMAQGNAARAGDDSRDPGVAVTAPSGMTVGEIVRHLTDQGYTRIDEVERERGRYEVEATNPDGRRVELDIDAESGEFLKEEREDD